VSDKYVYFVYGLAVASVFWNYMATYFSRSDHVEWCRIVDRQHALIEMLRDELDEVDCW